MDLSGKNACVPSKVLSYLVDNDLSPDIAKALRLFSFDISHVNEISQFYNRPEGVLDPEIIAWCSKNGCVWITHDKSARKQHEIDLKTNRISVLWLHSSESFSAWTQFKTVVRVIEETQNLLSSAHGALHLRAGVHSGTRPIVIWAEKSKDMPKQPGKKAKLHQ